MKHLKKLDSIRAIAVLLVICWHWLPVNHLINTFPNGSIGVNTFFVLSGFLISKILLENKVDAARLGTSKAIVLKNFYGRRALRIFPVYYLTILILSLVLLVLVPGKIGAGFKNELFYSITYTINFYFFEMKYWGNFTSHLWSLAVEEQFYLLWPFVILFLHSKYLLPAISTFILIGIISQLFIEDQEFGYLPTYTCFDTFGLGAFLSWIVVYKPSWLSNFYKIISYLGMISLALIILKGLYGYAEFLPKRMVHTVLAGWIITTIVYKEESKKNLFPFILENEVLLFLGKISYGLYLYHIPLYANRFILGNFIKNNLPPVFVQYQLYLVFTINLGLLVLISWLSWIVIEKPFLKWKRFFTYQNTQELKPVEENTQPTL